jgi:hypothetical protein
VKALDWTFRDKSAWPRGEWDNEPDKMQWPDPSTGLPCLIVRGPSGALCGYVGVGPTHPWYGKDHLHGCTLREPCGNEYCEHSPGAIVGAHGGLTYSDPCAESDDEHGICHIAEAGDFEPAWWFGFDCAHLWDIAPGTPYTFGQVFDSPRTYKALAYVRAQVTALAAQIAAAA